MARRHGSFVFLFFCLCVCSAINAEDTPDALTSANLCQIKPQLCAAREMKKYLTRAKSLLEVDIEKQMEFERRKQEIVTKLRQLDETTPPASDGTPSASPPLSLGSPNTGAPKGSGEKGGPSGPSKGPGQPPSKDDLAKAPENKPDDKQGQNQANGLGGGNNSSPNSPKNDSKIEPGKISFPEFGNNSMDGLLGVTRPDEVKPPSEYLTYESPSSLSSTKISAAAIEPSFIPISARNANSKKDSYAFSPGRVAGGKIGELLGSSKPSLPTSGGSSVPLGESTSSPSEKSAPGISTKTGGSAVDDGIFSGIGSNASDSAETRGSRSRGVPFGTGAATAGDEDETEGNPIKATGLLGDKSNALTVVAGFSGRPTPIPTGKGIMALVGTFGKNCFTPSKAVYLGYCWGVFSFRSRSERTFRSPASLILSSERAKITQ